MKEAILKFIEDHQRVASQYERIGDFDTATQLRAVANLAACLLRGEDAGTLHAPPTEEAAKVIRAREKEFQDAESQFKEAYQGEYDDADDVDYECAHFEAARRVIDIMVRKPKAANLRHWLKGIEDGADFVSRYKGV